MHLLIVLQTHSRGDNQHYEGLNQNVRFTKTTKAEITRRCTRSLVESMNYAKELFIDSDFELVVYDDHSDDQTISDLKNNLNLATFKTQFLSLDTYGIMPSILKCYQHGLSYGKEVVYFAQDDYLYDKTAIFKMLSTMMETSSKLQSYTSIYPFDDPYRYVPKNTVVRSHLIRSQGIHWRTQNATASCFMVHHDLLVKEWDLFEAMGKHKVDSVMEDETINRLWNERGYYLFVPIPSLALHMQYDTEMDDQIDWASWWQKYDREEKLIPNTDKTILNIGFGGQKLIDHLYTDDLYQYREITLDIDGKHSPDIKADITNIAHIPNEFVDVCYTCHMIEHIHYFNVPIVIKELLRITKTGGFVRVITPNMKLVASSLATGNILDKLYDSNGGPISSMDMLYSSRYYTHKHGADFMYHKCGFTKEVFESISKEHNFNIKIKEIGFDLVVDIFR